MTLVGFGIAEGSWLSILVLLAAGLVLFIRRIAAEERALIEKFGTDYENYKKKTWALVPFVW